MVIPDRFKKIAGLAKILDFGIAKMTAAGPRAKKTRTGSLMGTPEYMAPEQCMNQPVSGKTDVYALGCILYEMLAGRTPFEAQESFDVLSMQVRGTAPPLLDAVPGVQPELAALVHRMLGKGQAERPTMTEVSEALLRLGAEDALDRVPPELHVRRPSGVSLTSEGGPSSDPQDPTLDAPQGPAVTNTANRSGSWKVALVAVGLIGLAVAAAPGLKLRDGQLSRPKPRPAAQVPHVVWQVSSSPDGAEILTLEGQHVGVTPWRIENERQTGVVRYVLRRAGYADRRIALDLNADHRSLEVLDPLPAPSPAPAAAAAAGATGTPAGQAATGSEDPAQAAQATQATKAAEDAAPAVAGKKTDPAGKRASKGKKRERVGSDGLKLVGDD